MSGTTEMTRGQPAAATEDRLSSNWLVELLVRYRSIGVFLVLLIVVGLTTIDDVRFVSVTSLQQLVSGASIIALLGIGETLVMVTGNYDLTVGSVLGLSAYAVGDIFQHDPHFSIALVFLIALGIGLVCGVVTGAVVTLARVPSVVVTLGMLYVIRGADALWAGGNQVGAASLPEHFVVIGFGTIGKVPYLAIIAIVAVGAAAFAVRTFRTPREFYATGSNPVAAELAGVPVRKRVFTAFVLSGAIAGIAGALWLTYFATVDSIAGQGYELQTIAAIVVGGVSVFGGSGSIIGAALGALLVNTMDSALVVVKVSSSWDEAFQGALLLAAIVLNRFVSLQRARELQARSAVHVS
jgi:rhamnose transport system permease protein